MSKGDKNRVSDLNAYWSSPLWDNLKKKTMEENITEDQYKPKRFLLLDDKIFDSTLNTSVDENK
jgi:hypothetical protein